jgi:hypothetical protein
MALECSLIFVAIQFVVEELKLRSKIGDKLKGEGGHRLAKGKGNIFWQIFDQF